MKHERRSRLEAPIALVMLGAGGAVAQPAPVEEPTPSIATVGFGVGFEKWSDDNLVDASLGGKSEGFKLTGALFADVGYRLFSAVAISAHLGLTTPRHSYVYYFCPDPFPGMTNRNTDIRYMSSELGIGLTVRSFGAWINPWVGFEKLLVISDEANDIIDTGAALAVGLEAGVDVSSYNGNAVSIFGKALVSRTRADEHGDDGAVYSQVALGVAYRFW